MYFIPSASCQKMFIFNQTHKVPPPPPPKKKVRKVISTQTDPFMMSVENLIVFSKRFIMLLKREHIYAKVSGECPH
jgi:hypothetical protein